MYCQIKCSKGSKENDTMVVAFEGKDLDVTDSASASFLSLADVRKALIESDFIGTPDDTHIWRFINANVKVDEKEFIKEEDRIVGISAEDYYPAKRLIINSENEIIISNVGTTKKPDLIGFAADYFEDKKLKVSCRLRNYTESDREKNAGKFQPVMLTNVIGTSVNTPVGYEFVCVCCEDSVIEFPVRCFGSVGFCTKAKLNGEIIYDSGVHWTPGDHDLEGESSITCMARDGKTYEIVVKNLTKDTSIVPGHKIGYQKITISAYDLLSWYDMDQNQEITIEKSRENDTKNRSKGNGVFQLQSLSLKGKEEKEQITIPKDSFDPGKIEQGDQVAVQYGHWYIKRVSEEMIGSVSIFMFVFKSMEDAEKIIGRYNRLTESQQEKLWGL